MANFDKFNEECEKVIAKNSKPISERTFEEDWEALDSLPREKYIEIYKILCDNVWSQCEMPTASDFVDYVNGKDNKIIDKAIETFGDEKINKSIDKSNKKYSNEESSTFMNKVISANTTDISDAGYFYKKLMASSDDIRIIEDDCGSHGVSFNINALTKEVYDFKIRFSFVEELHEYAKWNYDDFMLILKTRIENEEIVLTEDDSDEPCIHVRTPLSCKHANGRKLCKKCSGIIKRNYNEYFTPTNIGVYSTLMITEHATQASLDSMNKGVEENINKILERNFVTLMENDGKSDEEIAKVKTISNKKYTWNEIKNGIRYVIDRIGDQGVQARYYEVALISRVFRSSKINDQYIVTSMQSSISRQKDPLATFIFSRTFNNFIKFLNAGKFESNSIKTKIMMDEYNSNEVRTRKEIEVYD